MSKAEWQSGKRSIFPEGERTENLCVGGSGRLGTGEAEKVGLRGGFAAGERGAGIVVAAVPRRAAPIRQTHA